MMKLTLAVAGAAAAILALPALAASNAQTVRVTETEYRIGLSARPQAGTVTPSSGTRATTGTTWFAAAAGRGRAAWWARAARPGLRSCAGRAVRLLAARRFPRREGHAQEPSWRGKRRATVEAGFDSPRRPPPPYRTAARAHSPRCSWGDDVLLVEDEESITAPLATALAREGFDAAVARTAAEALERARADEPDVVLLDVMLPDGSGFDVCRQIRRTSDVPIIMVTARGEEADRIVARARRRRLRHEAVQRPRGHRPHPRRAPADGAVARGPAAAADTLTVGESASTRRAAAGLSPASRSSFAEGVRRPQPARRRGGPRRHARALLEDVWETTWFGSTKTLDVHERVAAEARRRSGGAAPAHGAGVGFRLTAPEDGA